MIQSFYEELADKPFLMPYLNKLFSAKFYYTIQDKHITIHFIPTRKLTLKKMKMIINRLLSVSEELDIHHPYIYWILPCKIKRVFPTPGIPISQEHINGGYTYKSGNTIYIYREEECPKVMIHELLHHSHLDTPVPNDPTFYKRFKIHPDTVLRPNEAIIEAWALLYHLKQLPNDFETLLQKELEWSLHLCKKLTKQPSPWYEETHAYSYVRLKTCILFFLPEFLKLKIPYDPKQVLAFFTKYNTHPDFLKAIQNAPDFKTNSFRLTVYGDW
jgi:hypothetical protein